jgi:hypothetical protein
MIILFYKILLFLLKEIWRLHSFKSNRWLLFIIQIILLSNKTLITYFSWSYIRAFHSITLFSFIKFITISMSTFCSYNCSINMVALHIIWRERRLFMLFMHCNTRNYCITILNWISFIILNIRKQRSLRVFSIIKIIRSLVI